MSRTIPPLDLMWLVMETPESPTHVGALLVFQQPAGRPEKRTRSIVGPAYEAFGLNVKLKERLTLPIALRNNPAGPTPAFAALSSGSAAAWGTDNNAFKSETEGILKNGGTPWKGSRLNTA